MTQPMLITFIILVCTFALIIQGKLRADLVALISLVILGLTGILNLEEALSGFSSPIVIMIGSLYVVGAGISLSGLADNIVSQLTQRKKGSEARMIIYVMATAGLLGSLLSGTAIVALMLPIVTSMALKNKKSPSRLLLPLAYATGLGGMLTMIGTTPNLVVSEILRSNEYANLTLFDFTPIGIVALVSGVIFMLTIGKRLLPNRFITLNNSGKGLSASELAGMYKVYDRLHYLYIPSDSDIVGERLSELRLPVDYEITVIEIKRKTRDKQLSILTKSQNFSAKADEVLYPEDIILLFGEDDAVMKFADDFELEMRPFQQEEIKKHFLSSKFGLTEVLIMPHSDYENQSLQNVHFREKYQCSVLAINRKGEYIQSELATEQLKPGDALLIHGEWENIERVSSDLQDVLVVGSVSLESETLVSKNKAMIAAGITLLMMIMLSIDLISPTLSMSLAALLMIITGCLRSIEEAYQRINWESVIFIGAIIPLVLAFEKSGGVLLVSSIIENVIQWAGPYGLLGIIYLLTMLLSFFIPNGAVAIIIAPIAYTLAENLQYSPTPILMCVAVAASMAFSSPSVSPSNALVMTAGEYTQKDFAVIGILLQLFIGIIMIFAIPFFFPF
ncbi:SLC13 family permease [Peribacillus huizhouensis]|uniref:Di/tricarboxylate transporter n=1 Tax=Peribacillus huizhouensis TaxID=1501239 RepID=A0ABR6CKB1_9BACI|nr:SLC13 family permease [Peribacillus huizhouensis]MBA9025048.1 di/tricarboxylate transporter [Peribacillus huizhouensis]